MGNFIILVQALAPVPTAAMPKARIAQTEPFPGTHYVIFAAYLRSK